MIIKVFIIMIILLTPVINVFAGEAETSSISLKREETAEMGSRYSLEFRDADLKDVLRALAQENRLNIIIGEDVTGRLTLSFKNVSLMEALDAILKINNLTRIRDGEIIRVIKSPFPEGEGDLVTKIIPISFASAKESSETLKAVLSKKGSVAVDLRTNSIIVRDVPENIDRISEIIKGLDSKTPQVLIEARIVEANTNFTRELGIQWGGSLTQNASQGIFQATGTTLTGGAGLSGSNFIVNLPANVSSGRGGALGLAFGNISKTFQLDLQLSAMEDRGHGRILSNPKILTLNNKEAKISSGTEILVPTSAIVGATTTGVTGGVTGGTPGTVGATTGVTTINAKLELTVTPHVTPDNQILMHVKTDKKDPDFNRQVQNIPPLSTRTAETDLLVDNGETIVIGGIFTRNESSNEAGVPWLSKIPFIGWLFKKESKVDNQNELLIFITPTIYKRGD